MQYLTNLRRGSVPSMADAGTVTFDIGRSSLWTVTLGGNRTLAITGDADGDQFTLIVKQDGTGGWTPSFSFSTITYFDSVTPSTGANKTTYYSFIRISTGVYHCFRSTEP